MIAALFAHRKALAGAALLAIFAAMALAGPLIAGDATSFVGAPHQPPSAEHWLGTTGRGQDVLAQAIAGARVTLAVGFAVGLAVTLIAAALGLSAAYLGGWIDDALSVLVNVALLLPGVPLAVVVTAFLPPSPSTLALVLVATGWAWNTRVLRAQALAVREREFIRAAEVGGESAWRIIAVEILPNLAPVLASCFIGATTYAIAAQVGLEFLGLGDPGTVSWGTILYWARNDAALYTGSWWLYVPAGLCVALVGFALVLVNSGLDEAIDPRLAGLVSGTGFSTETPVHRAGGAVVTQEPAAPAPLLEVVDLRIEYGGTRAVCAVDRVSFSIAPGEILGLAGESGSGKSTIAHAILRILQPPAAITGGAIRFAGRDVLAMSAGELRRFRWREIALVMQNAQSALNPVLTIGDQLVDTLQAHERISRPRARARAAELLDRVGIGAARAASFPHQLSGGMRQRVAIAMALALEPRLLVLDEPTTALDVVVQRELLLELADLRRRLGFAMLFISHDLGLLFEMADRVAVLYAGAIVEEAAAGAMWREPRHPYTQGLIASAPDVTSPHRPRTGVPGSPPDLRALPSGCSFHPRCTRAVDACRIAAPPLRTLDGRRIACDRV